MHGQAGTESWVSPVDKKRELNNRLARRPHHHGQPTSWRYTLSCLVNSPSRTDNALSQRERIQ